MFRCSLSATQHITRSPQRSGRGWLLGPAGSLLVAIALSGSLAACGNSTPTAQQNATQQTAGVPNAPNAMPAVAGEYPVQQASYNNSTGEYTLMLLNAPPGINPYRVSNLQMAQLTEAALKAGKTSYLALMGNGGQPVLYLQPSFKIEMLSGAPAANGGPVGNTMQAGVQPTYWQPMGGGGELDIDLDFHQPYYYVPPPYRAGSVLMGYGGYGRTYERAASTYQQRYNAPPVPVQTRNFRTTPNLRPGANPLPGAPGNAPASAPLGGPVKASSSRFGSNAARTASPASTEPTTRSSPNSARSSGSGYGSSTLRSSGSSSARSRPSNSSNRRSFGSGRRRR